MANRLPAFAPPLLCARWAGSTKKDSNSDSRRTEITTAGISLKIRPIVPGTKNNGANAATVVRIAKVTGIAISFAAATAAWGADSPFSRKANVRSPTTIASSTTMPSVTMNANVVTMLIEISAGPRISSAPRNEIGMPSATQNASRKSMNTARITTTSTRPSSAFLSRRFRRSRRISESSRQTSTEMFAGSLARKSSA